MAKKTKYTSAEKKAYYMGYGLGVADRNNEVPEKALDNLLVVRAGRSKDLVDSSVAGYWAARKKRNNRP